MGGDASSMLGEVAGRVLGVLSALPSRGGGFSNLANYMAARQRAMSDPNARAALTPFSAGFYQIGGGTEREPGTYQPVAAPADFMGPTIPTPTGPADVRYVPGPEVWRARLPPLAPEAALEEEAKRRTLVNLQSPDIVTRARAKQDAKIPLTPEETDALIAAGTEIRRAAGPESSVTIGPGGTTVTLGSRYGVPPGVVQTPPAGEMPREQLPLLPGQVPQFTGRYNANGQPLYTAVTPPKQEPAGVAPLPPAAPQAAPPAAPPPVVAAPPPPPPPVVVTPPAPPPPPAAAAPPAAPPVVAAPPPAPAAPAPAAPPPAAAAPPPAPVLPPHEVVRRLPDGTFVPVTPPPPAGGAAGFPSPAFATPPEVNVAAAIPPPSATTVTPTTPPPPPAETTVPVYPAQGFVFHHSGGSTLEGLRNTLQKRGLGSQYLMDRDGTIYSFAGAGSPHIRPNDQFGGIAPGLSNKNAIGMEVVAKNDQDITPEQVASARRFISANYADVPVYGHGEVNPGHKMADEGLTIVKAIRGDRGVQPGTPVPRRAPNTVDLAAPFFRQVEASRGLPPGVLSAMADKESSGNPLAESPVSSARGLYGITKDTARAWGISANDRLDPVRSTIAVADTLAARAQDVGLERAIGMHYGGPGAAFDKVVGASRLSPAQYSRDVLRRAAKYAPVSPAELGLIAPKEAGLVAFAPPAFAEPGAAPAAARPGLPAVAPIAPPSAVPWAPAVAGAPGPPPVVVVAPPVAPAAPVAPPPGVPAGAGKFTQTQPIKPEAGGGTVTFTGEVPGAPKEPTVPRGGFNETIFLRENGIDPANPPKGTTELLRQTQLDFDRRQAEVQEDVKRRYGDAGAAVNDSLTRLKMFRSFVNTLLEEFSPEERARYVGMGGLTPVLKGGAFSQDPRFLRFRSLNAALRTSVFAEAGKAVTAPELALLAPTLPSGGEPTDAGYESALQLTTDKLDRLITGYGAQANMRTEDLTPEKQRLLIEQYLSGPEPPRYGPYDWVRGGGVAPPEQRQMVTLPGQVIQGGAAAPPPSPFVVDRLYTLPAPAR